MSCFRFFLCSFFAYFSLFSFLPLGFCGSPELFAGAAALPITPVDENGVLWEEPYDDLNGNGRYDAPNPLAPHRPFDRFEDLNQNGKWDGPFLAGFHHFGPYYTAKGVHDPIWSRVLVLKMGETKIGLVALDLVGFFYSHVLPIRKEVKDLGFSQIIVASTHTHGGPDSMGLWGPNPFTDGKDPRFIKHIQDQTIQALRDADRNLQPATLRFAKTTVPMDFGSLINDFRDPIVIDNLLLVMQVLGQNGKTLATVVNWSPHPETMGGTSSLITSDFPHYLREGIEKGGFRVGKKRFQGIGGIAIYFSGAVGGLLTTLQVDVKEGNGQSLPPRSWSMTRRIGQIAAGATLDALRARPVSEITHLSVLSKGIFIPLDNHMFRQLSQKGVFNRPTYTDGKAKKDGRDILTEVNVVTFQSPGGPVSQMITVPGELFPEILVGGFLKEKEKCWGYTQRKRKLDGRGKERLAPSHPNVPHEPILRQRMKGEFRFLIGLANDELGYIVPANDFIPPVLTSHGPRYGTDRCGDNDHYEETVSASSKMAPYVTQALVELLEEQARSIPSP